jgi:hypothetical protein
LVRDRISVDGGAVDVDAEPVPAFVPVVRIGVLVRYAVSLDDRFEEKEEIWVEGRSGLPLDDWVSGSLGRAPPRPGMGRDHRTVPPDLNMAVAQAHRQLEERASIRRGHLATEVAAARERERQRTEAHYDAALAAIEARSASGPASGQSLYAAQSNAIRAERSRRLLEIGQQPPPTHEIRPFRLHVVAIPALRVPVTVVRGAQSFSFALDWYLPFQTLGPVACPHCHAGEPLVVGSGRLGCRRCMAASAALQPSSPRPYNGNRPALVTVVAVDPVAGLNGSSVDATPVSDRIDEVRQDRNGRSHAAMVFQPAAGSLAKDFWEGVAEGQLWPRRLTLTASPFEVITRLYGAEGPLRAVGMPPGCQPTRITSSTRETSAGDRVTTGLLGAGDASIPYTLRWELIGDRPVVVELLPFASFPDGGSPLPSIVEAEPVVVPRLTHAAPHPPSLGPVEEELWTRVATDGLPFVVRCLVVWRRLEVKSRLAGVDPRVLAASVALVCAERCGIETTVRSEAERHGVSDFAVSHVSRQLHTLVRGMRSALW